MDLQQAKEIVLGIIANPGSKDNAYVIDEAGIIETQGAWYIPYKIPDADPDTPYVGSYWGCIIDKTSGNWLQPGGNYLIDTWLKAFELGLQGKIYDLVITHITDRRETARLLNKLRLQYVKPEFKDGVTWKIPKQFTSKMIEQRLASLPCVFKNQNLYFKAPEFIEISEKAAFTFQLVEAEDQNSEYKGERLG
jgi:hypothetical protein